MVFYRQARFQILDQIMEKMGGMLEQGQAQQLQAILRLHYPLVYEAWMDLSGRSVLELLCDETNHAQSIHINFQEIDRLHGFNHDDTTGTKIRHLQGHRWHSSRASVDCGQLPSV